MTKLLNVLIVLLAALLVFVIVYPQVQQNRPIAVRIGCDSTIAALPVLVGIQESLFVREKVVPSLVFYSDPDQALDDLFAGRLEAGVFPWSTILRRVADKKDTLKVLLSEDYRQSLPVDAIIAPLKSPVRTPADLRGRRLAYPPAFRDYLPVLFLNLGFEPKDVKATEVPFSGIMDQLAAGACDAALITEPLLCPLDTTKYRIVQLAAAARYISQPFPGAAFGVAPKLLRQHRLAGGRLKVAIDAAAATAETKSDLARQVVGRYFDYCATACGFCRLPELQRLAEVNRSSIQALAVRLRAAGVLADSVDIKGMFVDPATLKR
jgi:ABC-type nitrate/sulfonate/bicarbonate transport system substrate-binding protein